MWCEDYFLKTSLKKGLASEKNIRIVRIQGFEGIRDERIGKWVDDTGGGVGIYGGRKWVGMFGESGNHSYIYIIRKNNKKKSKL